MRKQFMIVTLSTLAMYCEAIDLNTDEFYVPTDIEEGIVVSKSELIHVVEGLETIQVKSRVPRPKIVADETGLVRLKLPTVEIAVIDLNGRFVQQASFPLDLKNSRTNGINNGVGIKASSFLVENLKAGKVEYRPENLLKRVTREKEVGEYLFGSTVPWVPDVKVDKLPTLSITSQEPIKAMLILNGFVDVRRENLFRENSRIKEIEMRDTASKRLVSTFKLEDSVRYQRFELPNPSKSFDMVITDSYLGSKYPDICVTSIVFDEYYSGVSGDYGAGHIDELRKEIRF